MQTSKRKIHLKFTFYLMFIIHGSLHTDNFNSCWKQIRLLFYLFTKILLGGKKLRRCACFCKRVVATQRLEEREKLQKRLPRPRNSGQGKDNIM